jgi:exoribonuclease R
MTPPIATASGRGLPDASRARDELTAGLAAIRLQYQVPTGFPPEVVAAAEAAAVDDGWREDHRDATDLPFVTLDPAASTDLDQAFTIERGDGDDLVLRYAIADVPAFVAEGGPIEAEAWRRGVTTYLPDGKAGLYPPVLAEGAASLLPDGPRPAFLLSVRLPANGEPLLAGVERVVIRSRAKLAYESATAADLPAGLEEFAARIVAAEDRRGASRVEFPEQEVEADPDRPPDGVRLVMRPRLESEDRNSALSLAANLAVAGAMYAAHTGLFRVMAEPSEQSVRALRFAARALAVEWPEDTSLEQFERRLDTRQPHEAALLLAIRRAGGGASYEPYCDGVVPWHSAMAATYAQATAPLRRLADRYVLQAAEAVWRGQPVPAHVADAFTRLPEAMANGNQRAGNVERAVVDLVEAVSLADHVGELFDAVVMDVDRASARIQLVQAPVIGRVDAHRVTPGDQIRVRLVAADPKARRIEFQRVG